MKKLFLFLTLLFVGIEANAQYTPSNNLNYVKLLKVPPAGSIEDSIMVYDGSDSFIKMRPASSMPISTATQTYIDSKIPADYSKIVYVNNANPNSATIFDLKNPPTVNDNLLKTDVNNLYIANNASTWVYNSGSSAYVTKIVSSATSNFYLTGTTTDAGNSKTAHITRTGNVGSSSFIKNVAAVSNTYASVANNTLVIGARGMGLTPAIMARTNSPTVTAMHLTTMQSSDVTRTAEDDMSFRNGYEAGGDSILGYSTAGSAFGFYNGSFENLNIFRNGNVNINPPATITPVNAGYRLDVGGTARIQGLLTTTDIMSTGVVTTNTRFNANTPYTSSQVGTAGVSVQISPRTITNSATASGGTVAQHVNNGFLIPTFSATSTGVTYTNASNVFIDGAPTAGTNVSITNPWSFYVNSGKSYFGGDVSFIGTVSGVTKSMVGLGSVDNTSDVNKPVSTATQTALDLKANLASPALTGNPTAPTPTAGDNDTSIATTAYVTTATTPKITITTAVSITTATNDAGGLGQNGRHVVIDNGASVINITCNGGVTASYGKVGAGAITFVQGSGRTLVQLDGTAVLNGIAGSIAILWSNGTTDYLSIINY